MASKPSIDLLIIGAGPVGLTAAIEAQRLGLSCRIVERKEKRSDHDSRAVVIHPRMMELLEAHPGMIQNVNKRASILPYMNMELINVKTTITILKEEQRSTELPTSRLDNSTAPCQQKDPSVAFALSLPRQFQVGPPAGVRLA